MKTGNKTARAKGKRGPYFTQQGVALIAVSVTTAIVGVLVAEFSTNTNVDMAAAYNARANMKAHFLAKSGMNLSRLLIRLQTQVLDPQRRMIGDIQIGDYVGLFIGAFGGSKEEVDGLAAMIGGFSGDDIRGLGVPEGSFDVAISTDDKRINMNCAKGQQKTRERLKAQLDSLFYFEVYNDVFQNEDAEGWRRDRETQVAAFMDYIDPDRTKYDAPGAQEDYGYEGLRDKYESKNNYLDTIEELKLVRGVDDRFWTLFGDAFTIYGSCRINLSAVDNPQLIASVIYLSAKDKNDPYANDYGNLMMLSLLVLKAREFGFQFSDERSFAEFVKSPQDALGQVLGMGAGAVDQSSLPIDPGIMQMLQGVHGIELDVANDLTQIATVGPRRTYRVEATATYGKLEKRIVGVWDTRAPNKQNTRRPGNLEDGSGGRWVFWKEY